MTTKRRFVRNLLCFPFRNKRRRSQHLSCVDPDPPWIPPPPPPSLVSKILNPSRTWRSRLAKKEEERVEKERLAREAFARQLPSPLGPRARALTLTDDEGGELQLQSALMHLPREMRYMIWIAAIGGNEIFVIREKGLQMEPPFSRFKERIGWRSVPEHGIISPLLTCRCIYSEAIDILYQHNRITLLNPHILHSFRASLLPSRWATIRDLCFLWDVRHISDLDREEDLAVRWLQVWDVLATYTQLRRLRVEIKTVPRWREWWRQEEKRLLGESRKIDEGVELELMVGWQEGNGALDLGCKLTRMRPLEPGIMEIGR